MTGGASLSRASVCALYLREASAASAARYAWQLAKLVFIAISRSSYDTGRATDAGKCSCCLAIAGVVLVRATGAAPVAACVCYQQPCQQPALQSASSYLVNKPWYNAVLTAAGVQWVAEISGTSLGTNRSSDCNLPALVVCLDLTRFASVPIISLTASSACKLMTWHHTAGWGNSAR